MTNTELKLKRERMLVAFKAGKASLEALGLPYFLAYGSALGALREGEFQPHEDDVNVGIYQWDLAALQRGRQSADAMERDEHIISVFHRHGFEPVTEVCDPNGSGGKNGNPDSQNACPRMFQAEAWTEEQAYPILYKFTHRESYIKFDIIVFASQFGQLWDFADGGAETSSGWRYSLFSPQPLEFHKMMTFTMPAKALEEHYGQKWHEPRVTSYVLNLAACHNRCQVLRVYPFDVECEPLALPAPEPWEIFKREVSSIKMKSAQAMIGVEEETPAKELDLFKVEAKPMILFQAAGICKAQGNELLKNNQPRRALEKYDEGRYIMSKCREVLRSWRVMFKDLHDKQCTEKKEKGMRMEDLADQELPAEFAADMREEQKYCLALLLNGSQAALLCEDWEIAVSRATSALEVEPKNLKAHYRRGIAWARLGKTELAKADFLSMYRHSGFDSREALQQLLKLMSKEDVEKEVLRLKHKEEREEKLSQMMTGGQKDERIAIQDERYERFKADMNQRKVDGVRQMTFDDWAEKYEWRYDAAERTKNRKKWPATFNHMGPAPLPIEEWEVDYLTHKEIEKIMYQKETEFYGQRRLLREGPRKELINTTEAFECDLELDDEDQEIFQEQVIQKGYNYWW